jgi:N-acyl amino acid synthase of PEP-CTERM/exosortase system
MPSPVPTVPPGASVSRPEASGAAHGSPHPPTPSAYFTGLVLDDHPELLRASYALRYQVYCLERHFLAPDDYPDQLETDEFDQHSIHMGVVNAQGELAATARLVQLTPAGLPSFDHCTFYAGVNVLRDLQRHVIEVSRLSVSRSYNRRAGDEHFGLGSAPPRTEGGERRSGGVLVMTLYKAMYQTSKRRGITDWMAATEKSLQRLVTRSGFPFRQIGPETDYYGPVAPYLLDLAEFDANILSGRFPPLSGFTEGLEAEFMPGPAVASTASTR